MKAFTIFRKSKNPEEKKNRFEWTDKGLKQGVFIPLMRYAYEKKKMLRWKLIRRLSRFARFFLFKYGKEVVLSKHDIPDEPYNKNMKILWDAFELSSHIWYWEFFKAGILKEHPEKRPELEKEWQNRNTNNWYCFPKVALGTTTTVCLEDTAYREWLNIYMHTLHELMNKEYNPELKHEHVLYTSPGDHDFRYFVEWMMKKEHEENMKRGNA
jgi:hypothetical protein